MFFSIEASNARGRRWIAGFFRHREAAEAFLQSVPEEARAMQGIVEVPLDAYPVFIIEHQGFAYGDIHFVRARLRSLEPAGNEDHVHWNIYAICEDFSPRNPGIDRMGSLHHWHVKDRDLEPSQAEVFDEVLSEITATC